MCIITDEDIRIEMEEMFPNSENNKACYADDSSYDDDWENDISQSDEPLWI